MAKDNLEERLRTHVSRLAGDIGERNVFRPLALEAASSYLERQWREQGYAIGTLAYEVSSIRCANLEVTRRGGVRIAFVNEEPPFFRSVQQGSMVYAAAARRRKDDIRLMASLETIGWYSDEPGSQSYPPLFGLFYPARANFLGIVSDFRSRTAMQQLAAAFRAHSHFPLETAATLDTAFYRYRHYHRNTDTPNKLNYPALAAVTHGLASAFAALAQQGI